MLRLYRGWIVVVVSATVLFVNASLLYSFGVFFKPILEELNCGRAVLSACYSLALIFAAFGGIFGGKLSDKFSLRVMLTSSGILLAIGYLLMSQASSVLQIYVFYALASLGLSFSFIPAMSKVSSWFVEKRGLAIGITVAGFGLGGVAAPLVSQWLISLYGWHQSYAILGLIGFIVIIPFAQLLRYAPPKMMVAGCTTESGQSSVARDFSYVEAIKSGQFWKFLSIMFCFGFSIQTVVVHVVPYATDMGIAQTIAAGILSLIAGTSVIGRVGIGFVSDKIGNQLCISSCLTIATLGLIGLMFAREIWTFYITISFLGIAYGGIVTLQTTRAAQLFGLHSLGVINGSILFGGVLGGSLGAFLGGLIFDMTESYMLILLIGVVFCVLSVCLNLALFKRRN